MYGLELNDLPLDRLSEQKTKRMKKGLVGMKSEKCEHEQQMASGSTSTNNPMGNQINWSSTTQLFLISLLESTLDMSAAIFMGKDDGVMSNCSTRLFTVSYLNFASASLTYKFVYLTFWLIIRQ